MDTKRLVRRQILSSVCGEDILFYSMLKRFHFSMRFGINFQEIY